MRTRALALMLMLLAGCAPAVPPVRAGPPQRIVSINPCADAILAAVADPARIAGISHYSQDPRATSVDLAWARRFPATGGSAEEVLALRPDLVVAGGHVDPATIAALARLGIPVRQLGVPATIAEARAQVVDLAQAIGAEPAGDRLAARIDAAVAAAAAPQGRRIAALVWQGGGLVPGAGTLTDDLMTHSGFGNRSADYGLAMWDVLPLERLVASPPALLLLPGATASDPAQRHPVLARIGGGSAGGMQRRVLPDRLLRCGGPVVVDALGALTAIRKSL